jgi:hypothetical protein
LGGAGYRSRPVGYLGMRPRLGWVPGDQARILGMGPNRGRGTGPSCLHLVCAIATAMRVGLGYINMSYGGATTRVGAHDCTVIFCFEVCAGRPWS